MKLTLKTSLDKQFSRFSPVQSQVHMLAYKTEREKNYTEGKRMGRRVEILQYFALPIDCALQAFTMPITTVVDHIKDISADIKAKRKIQAISKVVASIVTLPLKLIASLVISVAFVLNGAIQVVLPFHAVYSVYKGASEAEFFHRFYTPQDINWKWNSLYGSKRGKQICFAYPIVYPFSAALSVAKIWVKRIVAD